MTNRKLGRWLLVALAIVLLFPDLYRECATAFLYERPESIGWTERFRLGIRAIGALYVVLAVKTYRERHDDSWASSTPTAEEDDIWFISAAGDTLNLKFDPQDSSIIEREIR